MSVRLAVLLFLAGAAPLAAQDALLANSVTVTPQETTTPSRAPNTAGHTGVFTVVNGTGATDTYEITCGQTGPVTCTAVDIQGGGSNEFMTLTPQQQKSVTVTYSVGATGVGTLTLSAAGVTSDEGASTVPVAGPPTIALQVPGAGTRAVVHNRQPVLRAFFTPTNELLDTTRTRLVWRGDTLTAAAVAALAGLVRHNRRLLEWEVDSTRWLRTGLPGFSGTDSAQIAVLACGVVGGCDTLTRWVVLPQDSLPILGFTGMAEGTVNGGFSAPFGPGLSVTGAELETGFAVPTYVSLGVARSAGLVYSTRQSYPRALVHVDLDLPYPAGNATSIKLVLLDGGIRLDSLVLASPATACLTGTIRRCRATLQGEFTSGTSPSITRKWLTVEATVVSGTARMTSDSVEVVLVDRRSGMYGSGWWPAGFAKLAPAGNDRILVGPSGSATVYRGQGDSVYLSPRGSVTELRKVGALWELRARGSLAVTVFDPQGRLLKAADASGNRDSLVYTGLTDTLKKVIDPIGKQLTLAYASGKLASITDPGGRQSTVTIDGSNRLIRRWLASPASRPDTIGYSYQAYPGTNTMVLLSRRGVVGDTTRVVYDSAFRRRPVAVRLPRVGIATDADTIPIVSYTAYERQGVGALRSLDSVYVQMQDPRGHWTRSLLNRWTQSRRSWDALGLLSKATYDPDGFLLSAEGKNGDSSRVYSAYDASRRLVRTWIERGGMSGAHVLRLDSLVYDANHRVTKRIDPRGQATEITYDALGRVTKVRTPNGAAWDSVRTWYRSDGLVDSTRHSGYAGKAERYTYDATWKNLERVISNTSDTLSWARYDAFGRATSTLRRERIQFAAEEGTGLLYQWTKSEAFLAVDNRADSSRALLGARTSGLTDTLFDPADTLRNQGVGHRYDQAGRDTARVNGRGKATTWRLDRLGRVLARRPWADSVDVKDSTVYDIAGNVHQVITRRGTTITHTSDSRNRTTLTVVPGVGTVNRSFGGPQDQLTRVWLTGAVDSIGGVNAEVRSGYDSRGRLRADTAYTGTTARVATYAYDTYERSVSTTDAVGTWSVRYETVRGLPDTLITPLGDTIINTINSRGQLTDRSIRSTGQKLAETFAFKTNASAASTSSVPTGANGNYTAGAFARVSGDTGWIALSPTWTQRLGAGGAEQVLQDSTAYDARGRLTRWHGMQDGASVAAEDYTFDRTGNISQASDSAFYDPVTDRLRRRVIGSGQDSLAYDRAGNLTRFREANGVVWVYGYDALERLVSVRRNAALIARYGYDVLGRRIVKRVYSTASGGTVGYLRMIYRGSSVAVEADSAGTLGLKYTYGGTDQLLALTDGTTHYYVTTDRLGSVRSLAKRDGTWAMTQRFGPYGARLSRDTSASYGLGARLRYGWTGREWDAETGLSFHRARYLHPALRRWTQEDPIGYAGGPNLYGYVSGRPLEARDPSGQDDCYPQLYRYDTWDLKTGERTRTWFGYEWECYESVGGAGAGWGSGGSGGGGGGGSGTSVAAQRDTTSVNCRPVGGSGGSGVVGHCALRVFDPERGLDVVIELLDVAHRREIYWRSDLADAQRATYLAASWITVPVPAGMTQQQFDDAILRSALRETVDMRGDIYTPGGRRNSNRFVYESVTGAGGSIPDVAWRSFFFGAPGLCGGGFSATGRNCSQ